MDERITEQDIFEARWYVNGFPKSGTHLVTQLIRPVAGLQRGREGTPEEKPWAGTFKGNSWTEEWVRMEKVTFKLAALQGGRILKGHCGYREEIERFLWYYGTAMIFVYRDLRDVAISQAHHIMRAREDDHLAHPEPERFLELGGFNEVLSAVICGLGKYSGVVDRWRHYAPWLDVKWVLSVRFEDVRRDPKDWAKKVLAYGLNRTAMVWGARISFEQEGVDMVTTAMANATKHTELSPTFRKGNIGDWKSEFTPQHVQMFKDTDKENWLVRLGYEESEDWDV